MALAGLLSCLVIFFCILMISDISRFVEIEVAMVFGIIISPIFLLMFVFMFIDKILCKVRRQ